jgi:RHS repeat-associated protein
VTLPNGTAIDYVIDGQNRRVGKKVNGVMVEWLLYRNQLQPAAWLNGDGTVKARFVYGGKPNVPEYMVTTAGATYRLITDQVGSVRLVVDTTSGAVAERIDWDEFGNVLADSAPGTQPFGYAGEPRDRDTALIRFGARDYDPVTGTWTAKDPIDFDGGQANLYEYVGRDPINETDPEGLDSEVCVRKFYPATSTPYARHCFVRFNGNNNDTLSFDPSGVHSDPNPGSATCSKPAGKQNDDCVRQQMKTCEAKDYNFLDFNCCMCASNALNACGLAKQGPWPNYPYDATNPPYVPPRKKKKK